MIVSLTGPASGGMVQHYLIQIYPSHFLQNIGSNHVFTNGETKLREKGIKEVSIYTPCYYQSQSVHTDQSTNTVPSLVCKYWDYLKLHKMTKLFSVQLQLYIVYIQLIYTRQIVLMYGKNVNG